METQKCAADAEQKEKHTATSSQEDVEPTENDARLGQAAWMSRADYNRHDGQYHWTKDP